MHPVPRALPFTLQTVQYPREPERFVTMDVIPRWLAEKFE